MKYLKVVVLLFLVSCHCDEDPSGECYDPSRRDDAAACYEILAPVCGCDGKTYPNDCFAKAAGVRSWTTGKCE